MTTNQELLDEFDEVLLHIERHYELGSANRWHAVANAIKFAETSGQRLLALARSAPSDSAKVAPGMEFPWGGYQLRVKQRVHPDIDLWDCCISEEDPPRLLRCTEGEILKAMERKHAN